MGAGAGRLDQHDLGSPPTESPLFLPSARIIWQSSRHIRRAHAIGTHIRFRGGDLPLRALLRQLPERVHLPVAARSFRCESALGMSEVRQSHRRIRQYPGAELDSLRRAMPRV